MIHPSQSYSPTIKWRYRLELVQIRGFRSVEVLLDTPPGSPKNCPEAKGGSVRVQISLSRPVSFFMVKPRLCPRQVPVIFKDSVVAGGQTIWGIFGHICRSPSCDVGTTGVFCLRSFLGIVCQVLCRQQERNPPMLGMFWGGLVFPRPRIQRVLTLSPKSGLGTGFGLVALGKDDRIAWCWMLGPPITLRDEKLKVEGVRGQTQTRSERGETDTENWAVVWTGHMVRNKTLLVKDFISIWEKGDREGFEESGQVRIIGNQSVMAEQQYEMIQQSFN
ncbi:hypothetical protein F2Q69_00016278 [Brassica cretica]|uniref:Uncharacterized protein n=1 Tax=Brassica cretica TaxID=69181 RepID=A0A8S9R9J3_BRACR|nr:hypothetical protein F2Q69_00016278 [Brassica cretica]